MSEPLTIYIAGKFSAPTEMEIEANVEQAIATGIDLMKKGHNVICPHSMTWGWDKGTGLGYADFIRNGLALVKLSDAICLLEGWEDSDGATQEWAEAVVYGLQVFRGVDQVPDVS